ncbi:MAG: autotransporter outer membrane beta-barrel domain-containing protein [Rhizobiales bacterium]|nr:autotransporter outer membrane beta-barrel domain-containing protein [Hyphomicrobiales bacterium]
MSRFAFKTSSRFALTAGSLSLAFVLSLSVSHPAMAACTPTSSGTGSTGTFNGTTASIACDGADDTLVVNAPASTGAINLGDGSDTITVNGGQIGAITAGTGNDKVTINPGATLSGNISGGAGNDLIIINGGTNVTPPPNSDFNPGTGAASVGDTSDRMFMFGGTLTGIEAQLGSGQNPYFFFMGGTIQQGPGPNFRGSIEINRGSQNAVFVLDGGNILLPQGEGIEVQNGNGTAATSNAPKDPTIYFRSGVYDAGELELGGRNFQIGIDEVANGGTGSATGAWTNWTFIIDPINSKDASFFQDLANDATNGADPTLSTSNLNNLLSSAPANPNADHMMLIKTAELEFGGGDDKLTFLGAVNMGDGRHNLKLEGAGGEITELGGGGGYDILTVTGTGAVAGGSKLMLGEVEDFEELVVSKYSHLAFEIEDEGGGMELEFSEAMTVDGTSVVQLLPEGDGPLEVELETETLTLQSGSGLPGFFDGVLEQYAPFATGGILQIGAFGAGGDDDDDDDDGGEEGGPISLTIETDTFNNGGTLSMVTGTAGDTVTVEGTYISIGNNGKLALDTALGDSDSETDKLVLEGTVAGTTTIYINNAGGNGGFTGQGDNDGIVIVAGDDFDPDAFKLAVNALSGRQEVIGGGFAYVLRVNEDEVLLQSDILDQVPAYVSAPSVGQRLVSAGLDTLYKRLGEIRNGQNAGATSSDGLIWVRGSFSDVDVDAKEGYDFSQRSSGVTGGLGGVIAGDSSARLAVGIFGSYGKADAGVDAVIFGQASKSSVDADAWGGGAYATYYELGRPGTGLYVDTVVKADFIDFGMSSSARGVHSSADGDALTASGEVGYGFGVGGLVVQPQAQLAYTSLTIDGFEDSYGVQAHYGTSESLIGRLGVQLQANIVQADGGLISPYAIFNVYSEFEGSNQSKISDVEFVSDVSGTWYSAGGGVTAKLANALSFYGSGEYHFGDVEGWQGTGGLKVNW